MLNSSWLVVLLLHSALPQTTDKYSDEDRPYKFGFNIQGYQHRQEEKDEKGLIKGEYGFITADGYYRVTVYATDENGDFRIISMKNYYVGFPPEDPTTTPGSPSDRAAKPREPLSNPSFARAPGAAGRSLGLDDSTLKTTPGPSARPQGIAACSDCLIPTTTPRTNPPNPQVDAVDFRRGRTEGGTFGSNFGPKPVGQLPQSPRSNVGQLPQSPRSNVGQLPQSPRSNLQTPGNEIPQFPQRANAQGSTGGRAPQGASRTNPQFPGTTRNDAPEGPGTFFEGGNRQRPSGAGFASPKGRIDFPQNNQLDGTPGRRPQVGEVREGLPPGVSLNDIKDLLYTFNYTVGFHGHHEDGYRNGDKQGDYFFDGRDGVERKVEYLANEFGYQPNITLIDLPENDVRRPNEQTEKEYGLKGYEFKWFYRK